ncbi:hypothetical protein A2U01_0083920, partial [Trifolium medium]|nr:hypothetical protein [Trifolium medium]
CYKPSSLTRTQNIVRVAGCDVDDDADDVLPQTLIIVQPCNVYPAFSSIVHHE